MIPAKMSLLLFSFVIAVGVFIPARYSSADRIRTETQTYSSRSGMVPDPALGDRCVIRESERSPLPGVVEKKSIKTCSSSDADLAPPVTSERRYEYKSEKQEANQFGPPVVHEYHRTIIER